MSMRMLDLGIINAGKSAVLKLKIQSSLSKTSSGGWQKLKSKNTQKKIIRRIKLFIR